MSKSLQDQLLGAGLIDKKKAKQISKSQRKKKNEQLRSKEKTLDESKANARQAMLEKQEKDRQLNLERKLKADQKAIAAQIIQLIQLNKISRKNGEVSYNFKDGTQIKKIYVTEKLLDQISDGRLCIARLGEGYEIIPLAVADKILERDEEGTILVYNRNTTTVDNKENTEAKDSSTDGDDDYYAQFEIPDDLMW
ncbi:DUF2058 domain-containing protein [Agarilytica rhodophyticola]|uniref:DUF2058 domain-containing protein n=1 Tax=Agarilytica rhodophyticola TaxID=1737490 RepID=UPI000B346626|nr:DUF2058 domain-containing protein [Agarilytica rhodophyticola]